jgi:hypothetical protein
VIMMSEVKPKRPDGITAIAILWFLSGMFNVYLSFQTISMDVSLLPFLSDPSVHSWFSFGVPAEIAISLLSLFLGLLQIVTVFGLWTGKRYSYRLALLVPLILVIGYVCSIALYASAPSELALLSNAGTLVIGLVMGVFWLGVYWQYIDKPHVKAFLGVAELKPILREKSLLTVQEKQIETIKEETTENKLRFYCRYCGVENKRDAIYCESCGRKLKEP